MSDKIYLTSDEKITINNASALLDECLANADLGIYSLYAWALSEEQSIEQVKEKLDVLLKYVEVLK